MSTEFKHGVSVIEVDSGSRPIRVVSTSVIGLVATADDADNTTFPLNRPVLLTNLLHGIDKAGSQGTLAPTLHAIYKQANAMTVVVRVASNSDADEQDALVVGTVSAGRKTGLKALQYGARGFICKPFTEEQLVLALGKLIQQKQLQQK